MLKGMKILAVDDNQLSREMLSSILVSQGVICTTATNGKEAMDALVTTPDFDIVLLDLQMPVMNGFEVLRECKGNPCLSDIPIIVVAADHDEKLKALKMGADDFISKPYDREEMELRIIKIVQLFKRAQSAKKAKDEFIAIACHELQTPMHQILGLSELLECEDIEGEQREYLELLKQAAQNLTGTIADILNYVELDHCVTCYATEVFSLRTTVENAFRAHTETAENKGLTLVLDISDTVSDALSGPLFYISKVFDLLLKNAVKFSSNGCIGIEIRETTLSKFSSLFTCSVTDHGIGIPATALENIFEPFLQVDSSSNRKFDGIGLGLAIAKRMVGLMGGAITVQSDEGKGSTFIFSFQCQRQNV